MLKLYAIWFVTMSYFSITQPSDKCWFSSVNSNSTLRLSELPSDTFDETFATDTFFILFIIKVKIIISVVSFGSAKLTANGQV